MSDFVVDSKAPQTMPNENSRTCKKENKVKNTDLLSVVHICRYFIDKLFIEKMVTCKVDVFMKENGILSHV